MVKVSIVTPSFNQGQYIERTLRSVQIQREDGVELEHVVFDGGSTDSTTEILHRFGSLVRWVSEADRGQAHAVNKGLASTDGEIIGWLNSDDVYYQHSLIRVVEYFKAHTEIDVVYGEADHIDSDDHAFESYPTEPWSERRLWDTCFICQPALFFRRRVVEQCGLLDESLHYCMDYEYWLRLMRADIRFGYLRQKLAGSRLYPQNKTLGSTVAVHREINHMLRRFGPVPDAWLYNYAYVVTRAHRDGDTKSMRFTRELAVRALAGSLRWNHRISRPLLKRLFPNRLHHL